ncbi:hypothetical protein [Pseudomonas sp. PS01303]|jgi:hypothetical protein|uniref:hypothetical protein n=1 Tax=Pseudomonas sp. PS01303 TaxID=2991439 RepID=UPI00249A5475|nr:hypothetical protein [Pseudomonas sp. PS01303]
MSKNFVAVDWRSGPDRIYFFFKDYNCYKRFNLGDNKVPPGYPAIVTDHWHGFDKAAEYLYFGFTTTAPSWDGGNDTLWLFYEEDDAPYVCEFNQKTDKARSKKPIEQSIWAVLQPYFYNIVGVMWAESSADKEVYWFLMNDGNYLVYDLYSKAFEIRPLKNSPWAELEQYKYRMMTAVTNDYPTFDRYFYVFLDDNQYLKYEQSSKKITGPHAVSDVSWPGLIKD